MKVDATMNNVFIDSGSNSVFLELAEALQLYKLLPSAIEKCYNLQKDSIQKKINDNLKAVEELEQLKKEFANELG